MLSSRRQFLRQSGLAAGSVLLANRLPGAVDDKAPIPIIDAHIHFYDPAQRTNTAWPPKDLAVLNSPHLPKQFREVTRGLNVRGAVVVEAEAALGDNRWTFDLAAKEPLIVAYIARLTPGQSDFAADFASYTGNPAFRGLRLNTAMLADGLGTKSFERDVQETAERGLAVDVVGGTQTLEYVARLAKTAPGLRIIIDHLPFPDLEGNPAAMREKLHPVADLPNVYAKVSYVLRRPDDKLVLTPETYAPRLDALWEIFGPDRVIYGSNWPVSDLLGTYPQVLKTVKNYVQQRGHSDVEKYFWKNSQAAYRWQPRQ